MIEAQNFVFSFVPPAKRLRATHADEIPKTR
jgi:hypothetical protein